MRLKVTTTTDMTMTLAASKDQSSPSAAVMILAPKPSATRGLSDLIPCWATAETLTVTTVSVAPTAAVREALAFDQQLAQDLNLRMIQEIASLQDQEALLRCRSVDARISQLLAEFQNTGDHASNRAKSATVKQHEVANMLGITPAHLSRLLRRYCHQN